MMLSPREVEKLYVYVVADLMVRAVQVEAMFAAGTRLVTCHDPIV